MKQDMKRRNHSYRCPPYIKELFPERQNLIPVLQDIQENLVISQDRLWSKLPMLWGSLLWMYMGPSRFSGNFVYIHRENISSKFAWALPVIWPEGGLRWNPMHGG